MKFTYYTIIGRDLNLIRGHINNVKHYAGFDKLTCEKEIIVIIYTNKNIPVEVTQSLIEYCESEGIRCAMYPEPTNVFIQNLYACWNLGYEAADEGYVFRGGSDQVFSKNSFLELYKWAELLSDGNDLLMDSRKFILQANTIENIVALNQIGAHSRHFACDFGGNFETFDYKKFEDFIAEKNLLVTNELLTIEKAMEYWGKPTSLGTSLGQINRADGCSWLMTREEWRKYGPLPVMEGNITGDVIIHDRLQRVGYIEYILRDCVTYHFVRGESINKY